MWALESLHKGKQQRKHGASEQLTVVNTEAIGLESSRSYFYPIGKMRSIMIALLNYLTSFSKNLYVFLRFGW